MTARERLFSLEHFGIKLGLANITTLVDALGRPDRAYPVVHVAGTNGKGSVTAMVERGLRAAGHRTGRYTSPHLTDIEERIAIDGTPVAADLFDAVTADVLATVDDLLRRGTLPHSPTFFEVTTAVAFEIFRRAGVGVGVIEVGLGGRFDATNVVSPHVTAITSIALDHERHLGKTLAEIAAEKAGIIKPGVPVVIGPLPPDASQVITEAASARHAPLHRTARPVAGSPVMLALNGEHQQENAATAVALLRLCDGLAGLRIGRDHLVTAITDVTWPARLEWLRTADSEFLVDAAHNPSGAEALATYVRDTTGPLPLVFGVMHDKDVPSIVRALAPAVAQFIVCTAPSPRAMPAEALSSLVQDVAPTIPCESQPLMEHALASASHHRRAMIAGSIFLVGPARSWLLARGAVPVRYPSEASRFLLS